jgi:hypothetical protein
LLKAHLHTLKALKESNKERIIVVQEAAETENEIKAPAIETVTGNGRRRNDKDKEIQESLFLLSHYWLHSQEILRLTTPCQQTANW